MSVRYSITNVSSRTAAPLRPYLQETGRRIQRRYGLGASRNEGMETLEGKVYLVTGSTDGIGRHTAARLLQNGATVLIHGRNPMRVAEAAADLGKIRGGGKTAAYTRDLASLAEVRQLAQDVKRDYQSIDVLINNAGVFEEYQRESVDGFEFTWAVNVLAPFLLTHDLLDIVKQRIINVSSISASGHIDFDNLQQEKGYSVHSAYGLSKLAMQMFTIELATRIRRQGLVVNTLDPGTVNTKMLLAGWGPCGIDLSDADDEFWISTSADVAEVSGQYYVSRRVRSPSTPAKDKDARKKLWEILEVQTGVKFPAMV